MKAVSKLVNKIEDFLCKNYYPNLIKHMKKK